MIRKMICSILLLGTSLFSKRLDAYSIDLKQIKTPNKIFHATITVNSKLA